MTTGIGVIFSFFCVCAVTALQNSMMLRPRCRSAGPFGGEGFAAPAGTCNFRYPVTFFAICHSSCCFRTSPKTSQDRGAVQRMTGDHPSPPTALFSLAPLLRGEGRGEGQFYARYARRVPLTR